VKHLVALLQLLRPRQWVKNGFVLIGLLFGHAWHSPATVEAALVVTVAFCLASSAVYAFNDAQDALLDRSHPGKRLRPVARGAISPAEANVVSAVLGLAALLLALLASASAAWIVGAYIGASHAYTQWFKRVPVLDVVIIAAGFMLRLLAGTLGIGIAPSVWLMACGFLLTLFLGFAKRRAEIAQLAESAGSHRAVLERYSLAFLDRATLVCALGMSVAYAAYTLSPDTARLHGTSGLAWTVPWVLLGAGRYLYRLHRKGGGGDPTEELLRDPVLAASVAGWMATVLWLIG
jgi:4-hydroxybenzoate polyprenyltransferase